MRVTLVCGQFVAEGTYAECASWAYSMIDMDRQYHEQLLKKEAQEETRRVAELLNKPISELMQDENKEDDESHE